MKPPDMQSWNLALRLGLEIAALVALGLAAWTVTGGGARWIAVVAVPLSAATCWGVFNVLDDPSRSGAAPVQVTGWVRPVLELAILGAGAAGFVIAGRPWVAIGFVVLTVGHYAVSWSRIQWLLAQ